MKQGIHPNYREVLFVDLSNGFQFVTRSCVNTKEMGKTEDGRELPMYKLDTSASRTPSTPARKSRWTTWVAASSASATVLARLPRSKNRALLPSHKAARATRLPFCLGLFLAGCRVSAPVLPAPADL